MKNLFRLLPVLLALLSSVQPVCAQPATRTISGRVLDRATGEVLPGVSVQLKGATSGTTTDFEGHYTLGQVPAQGAVLRIEFASYAAQELPVPATGAAPPDVLLQENAPLPVSLDDGILRRRRVPQGHVTRVTAAEIQRQPLAAPPAKAAATRTISGRVTDAQGNGLPGAEMQLKGTKISATTDANGLYSLAEVPMEEGILLFSYAIGRFVPLEVPVGITDTHRHAMLQHPCSKPLARPK